MMISGRFVIKTGRRQQGSCRTPEHDARYRRKKARKEPRQEGPQEDLSIGCAPGEHVPHDGAHSEPSMRIRLFSSDHSHHGFAGDSESLNQIRNTEYKMTHAVVCTNGAARRHEMLLKILGTHTGENRRSRRRFSGPIGRPDTIFVQSGNTKIPYYYNSVVENITCAAQVYSWHALTGFL
jgi:hypothetical protein